jgi:glycosyltransferase involved in cell wall biosynthesis
MYPAAARKYDLVITVSEAEKRNYLKYINVPQNRFKVIPLAADERFRVIEDVLLLKKTKERYNLPDRFLLFVGRILPVKNIEMIIRGYHLAKKSHKIEHKLVIVGKNTWCSKKIVSLVNELEMQDHILFTGPIFEALPYVYNLADLFLFPSYYESFGAAPLEAMACGTPVLTTNKGGLPEVVGDAAIIVSSFCVTDFAECIIRFLSSEQLRSSLIQKGLERTKTFSWTRCAEETLKVYQEAINH